MKDIDESTMSSIEVELDQVRKLAGERAKLDAEINDRLYRIQKHSLRNPEMAERLRAIAETAACW